MRRTLSAIWLGSAIAILAVVGLSHLAPALGYRLVVVAGPSMEPSIPLGAVLVERDVLPEVVAVGDVVTMRMPNGVSITHRVVRVGAANGEAYLETRGDANAASDPTVTPASAVAGLVVFHVPLAGFVLAYLAMPTGILSVVLLLTTLLFAIWSPEAFADERATEDETRRELPDGLAV